MQNYKLFRECLARVQVFKSVRYKGKAPILLCAAGATAVAKKHKVNMRNCPDSWD